MSFRPGHTISFINRVVEVIVVGVVDDGACHVVIMSTDGGDLSLAAAWTRGAAPAILPTAELVAGAGAAGVWGASDNATLDLLAPTQLARLAAH